MTLSLSKKYGLYNSDNEKDACGIGLVCQIQGLPSHGTIDDGILILKNLSHRGAAGADVHTGDGAGILTQIPWALFEAELKGTSISLPAARQYGVGMIFLPQDGDESGKIELLIKSEVAAAGCSFLGWRDPPVDSSQLGESAKASLPRIRQFFVQGQGENLEKRLYDIRKKVEQSAPSRGLFHIASLSSRTLVYKGLLLPEQLQQFYLDLKNPEYVSAIALVHSRFSTNTFPTWALAHPFRYLCHNGEINTLKGNLNWMRARQGKSPGASGVVVVPNQSDSASLDNALEYLVMGGRSIPHALAMLIPEPWTSNATMDLDRRAFFEYHAAIMEPWDGPAAIICTDGSTVAATLDRNGLRPCRYVIVRDREHLEKDPQATRLILSSEAGVLPMDPADVIERGRLQPGRMLVADLEKKAILSDNEVKSALASRRPYRTWVAEHRILLSELPEPDNVFRPLLETLRTAQNVFGYTEEELRMVLAPMGILGEEPISSMGLDTPLPVLCDRARLLFDYFKQLFAQVTNPPIDPIREHLVMSLAVFIGPKANIHSEEPTACDRINLKHPILTSAELEKIRQIDHPSYSSKTLPMVFPVREGPAGLQRALDRLCADAVRAVKDGCKLLILSDRPENALFVPIPSLLAVAAVHETLVAESLRTETGLLVESGEPREVHHFACLLGYGAGAINPYVALDSLSALSKTHDLPEGIDSETAQSKYVAAVSKGLLKIFSKMGISAVQSYCGAQLFEAIGIGPTLCSRYFSKTASRVGGIEIEHLAEDALLRHKKAYSRSALGSMGLESGGMIHFRSPGEPHLWNPVTISTLQSAARSEDAKGAELSYAAFARAANQEGEPPRLLRSLLTFQEAPEPLPLDEIEPASEIVKRFTTGAMSLGAISEEAHRTLAIAMNRMGGKSNTGEGGEDPARFEPLPAGDSANSAIKQVASARFGVTTHYLVNAQELQIKIAQGAKPGEGGQLPGHKVDRHIAWLRFSTPGVQLISPPPHHDIYSIEDLAQLISDLKHVNPAARVSVKLVSEVGVGTITAGVVKAGADKVLISGDTGGTGASPLSSIQHAGGPWELGLAEAQQTLRLNGLRDRVRLETDGQLRTGRDVAIAALLGADEFGFATAPLIVEGCIMMRKCHLNTCPVGVATQDPELRARFSGKPEQVIRYFFLVAEDLRRIMASLGFRTVSDMVGRVDRLKRREDLTGRAATVDLSLLLAQVEPVSPAAQTGPKPYVGPDDFARRIAEDCRPALERGESVSLAYDIKNVHRSVGAYVSGLIAKRHGRSGLPQGAIHLKMKGSAGQSFGAFSVAGLTLELEGEANDYIGKGLSGARLIVYPHAGSHLSDQSIIVGNTAFYGATAGEAYIAGVAGERFAVRNSGATLVVEGVGDHGCEYMTGGRVVILGGIGRNFAAGMSGGIAYVWDGDGTTRSRCNLGMVDFERFDQWSLNEGGKELEEVRRVVENHLRLTGSLRSREILQAWDVRRSSFVRIIPTEYRAVLQPRVADEEGALS